MMKPHSLTAIDVDVTAIVRSVFLAGVVAVCTCASIETGSRPDDTFASLILGYGSPANATMLSLGKPYIGLFLNSIPFLKASIVNYGARASSRLTNPEQNDLGTKDGKKHSSSIPILSQGLALITEGVPHAWFIHYYLVSVLLSLFWGWQLFSKGSAFQAIAQHTDITSNKPTMTVSQTHIVWLLLLVQGIRRLVESALFMTKSASRMPWSIYAIGLGYYTNMSVAVWIEGTKAMSTAHEFQLSTPLPSVRTTVGLIVFTLASGFQHDCHAYLASLRKYTLPDHPAFHRIISPHYTAECVLYLALAFIGAPQGQVFNRTLLANVLFVVVNLGLVADESKRWSERQFGRERVRGRARMIPGIW